MTPDQMREALQRVEVAAGVMGATGLMLNQPNHPDPSRVVGRAMSVAASLIHRALHGEPDTEASDEILALHRTILRDDDPPHPQD